MYLILHNVYVQTAALIPVPSFRKNDFVVVHNPSNQTGLSSTRLWSFCSYLQTLAYVVMSHFQVPTWTWASWCHDPWERNSMHGNLGGRRGGLYRSAYLPSAHIWVPCPMHWADFFKRSHTDSSTRGRDSGFLANAIWSLPAVPCVHYFSTT